jgi:hypothetical protein
MEPDPCFGLLDPDPYIVSTDPDLVSGSYLRKKVIHG